LLLGAPLTLVTALTGAIYCKSNSQEAVGVFHYQASSIARYQNGILSSSVTVRTRSLFGGVSTDYMKYEAALYPSATTYKEINLPEVFDVFMHKRSPKPALQSNIYYATNIAGYGLEAFGWPSRSFAFEWEHTHGQQNVRIIDGIALQNSQAVFLPTAKILPLRILWRGLLIDVAFWGMAGILALKMLQQLKYIIRSKKGRCIRCGYNLAGISEIGCPECGWRRNEGSESD
jgi:hypothetical protein